ncbi:MULTISPECIES: hypothetical protein [unclassified Bosea (in: a-proteobacteria)]|uniref:hypothetical protein n=1 Tax=unclassified Bosea (in: a-proteobacteria) TaxID=2653178 RepID=UPI000F762CAF|nr:MULTISPECIES: hypothetical protein [unclassified Bosea (in: a-proteobacteria)]AZO80207.1 hypothetical protein BLM15_23450 [Bosea sp. Tri-49]RXT23002.1 hypothetical protein B5U98_10240 [Bosea sp. Tri-39]RXT38472.1 hypothetical protein B5U99_09690 [Bosea sp. Tri-54]
MVEAERPEAAFAYEEERTPCVSAAFLVQLAASHAGIGPFARRDRETPFIGARRYYEGIASRGLPRRLLRSA